MPPTKRQLALKDRDAKLVPDSLQSKQQILETLTSEGKPEMKERNRGLNSPQSLKITL
jgi:hypothetical protein